MNSFKTLVERQAETLRLIEEEIKALQSGYNPFDKAFNSFVDSLSFIGALKMAFEKVSISEITKRDLKTVLAKFEKAIISLGWKQLLISEVSRKHVKFVLDSSSNSEDRFTNRNEVKMIGTDFLT